MEREKISTKEPKCDIFFICSIDNEATLIVILQLSNVEFELHSLMVQSQTQLKPLEHPL